MRLTIYSLVVGKDLEYLEDKLGEVRHWMPKRDQGLGDHFFDYSASDGEFLSELDYWFWPLIET